MITTAINDGSSTVRVQVDGTIAAEDWEAVRPDIDAAIARHNQIRLLIDATGFNGWQNLAAARAHLGFVRDHHQHIERVAVISTRQWQHWLAALASHFVTPQLEAFDPEHRDAAQHWLETGQHGTGVSASWNSTSNVVQVAVHGKLRGDDYKSVFLPLFEVAADEQDKLNFVVDLRDFTGMDMSAFWEDLKFGLGNLKTFGRIAIVGNQDWIEWVSKAADTVTPFKIKAFESDELAEAATWAAD